MSSEILAQTAFLVLVRAGLFQFCRSYVLKTLIQDLKHLSSSNSSSTISSINRAQDNNDEEEEDAEDGNTLPQPVTSTSTSTTSPPINFGRRKSGPSSSTMGTSTQEIGTAASLAGGSSAGNASFHSRVSRAAFGLCFSESCTLFLLVILQSVDVLSDRARFLNWRISLNALLVLILLAIPFAQCLFLTYRSSSTRLSKRHLVSLIPYSIYLYALTLIPIPNPTPSGSSASSSISLLDVLTPLSALNRLTVLGVLILGILSGFGAVRNASILIDTLLRARRRAIRAAKGKGRARESGGIGALEQAEMSLRRVRDELEAKRRAFVVASTNSGVGNVSTPGAREASPVGSWVSRVFSGGDGLRQELTGLEALEGQMSDSVERMKARHAREAYDRTVSGRIWRGIGAGLGVYCIYRIFGSSLNMIIPSRTMTGSQSGDRSTPSDVIIHWILATFPSLETWLNLTPDRVISLSRQFSLLMVGVIVLSSVRLVLRGVNAALRVTSKNLGASFMLLILAQLMGIYLLSTLVQLRSSFPPPAYTPPATGLSPPHDPNARPTSLFSTLPEFELFGPLFDISFLLSAFVSGIARWIGGRFGAGGLMLGLGSEEDVWEWEMVSVPSGR